MALTCNKYFFLSKKKHIIAEAASEKIKGRYRRQFRHVVVGTDTDRGAIICEEMNGKQIIKSIHDGSTDEIRRCSRLYTPVFTSQEREAFQTVGTFANAHDDCTTARIASCHTSFRKVQAVQADQFLELKLIHAPTQVPENLVRTPYRPFHFSD